MEKDSKRRPRANEGVNGDPAAQFRGPNTNAIGIDYNEDPFEEHKNMSKKDQKRLEKKQEAARRRQAM